jgi:hypothetical protein
MHIVELSRRHGLGPYICIYKYIHTYTPTYIHTYIHTHIGTNSDVVRLLEYYSLQIPNNKISLFNKIISDNVFMRIYDSYNHKYMYNMVE